MRTVSFLGVLALGIAAVSANSAAAAEVTVLASDALVGIMRQLVPAFEHASGDKVTIAFQASGAARQRIERGQVTPDIAIVTAAGIDILITEGKVVRGSRQDVARLPLGVAVRAGAPKPDISTPEALKRALLAAHTIAYTDPFGGGVSGKIFENVLARLGIAEAVKAKSRLTKAPVGELVASGAVELGIQHIPELRAVPGIEIVGPLPPSLQRVTTLSAGILSRAKEPDAALAFMRFLATPMARSVVAATGMEPG